MLGQVLGIKGQPRRCMLKNDRCLITEMKG
jgi:hypothetical protein